MSAPKAYRHTESGISLMIRWASSASRADTNSTFAPLSVMM
jgi:hypothetical protein